MSRFQRASRWILAVAILSFSIFALLYINMWILFLLLFDYSVWQAVALTGGEVGVISLFVTLFVMFRALRRQAYVSGKNTS